MMKYIYRIGIELEGGWNYDPPSYIYSDFSVRIADVERVGEICSSPLLPHQISKWLQENYPSVVNDTCGMHIHISLKSNLLYSRLMSREFYEFFLTEIEKWGNENKILPSSPFWRRLNGENRYCRKNFLPDEQAEVKEKRSVRYMHLNYCFALHRTLECRLFPAFEQITIAESAIFKFLEIVETFLSQQQKREESIKVVLIEDDLKEEKYSISESLDLKEEVICV